MVGEHEGEDVQLFAGLGPQRLGHVHPAAVALQDDDLAVGAGDRRAGRAGSAYPIEPPVPRIQSCGRLRSVSARNERPVVIDSSTTMAFSGMDAASTAPIFSGVSVPVGRSGRHSPARPGAAPPASSASQSAVSAPGTSWSSRASSWIACPGPGQLAGLARIGEEGDRRLGAHQDDVLHAVTGGGRPVDRVGDPLHRDAPGTAGDARGMRRRVQARPGDGGDLPGPLEGQLPGRLRPEDQRRRLAGPQDARGCVDRRVGTCGARARPPPPDGLGGERAP